MRVIKNLLLIFLAAACLIQLGNASQISRLHTSTMVTGLPILSGDLNDELNQLVNQANTQDTEITNLLSGTASLSSNLTFNGAMVVAGTANLSGTNTVSGTINFTNHANFAQASDPASPVQGDLWFNTTAFALKYYDGFNNQTLNIGSWPTGYRASAPPVYASTSSITVAKVLSRSSDDTSNIYKTTSTTVSTGSTGLNGLDTGTVANSTFYYLYDVSNASSTGMMLSTANVAGGGTVSTANFAYTKIRQEPFAIPTNGSAQIFPFLVASGWPTAPKIVYNVAMTVGAGYGTVSSTGVTNILATSSPSTSGVTLSSAANFIPPIASVASFNTLTTNTTISLYVPSTTNYFAFGSDGNASNTFIQSPLVDIPVSSSGTIAYKSTSSSVATYIDVKDFTITGVP